MKFKEFTTSKGTRCLVNVSMVSAAVPTDGDHLMLMDSHGKAMLLVLREEFMQAIEERPVADGLASRVERLVQAMDRLAARFPSSIRLHL